MRHHESTLATHDCIVLTRQDDPLSVENTALDPDPGIQAGHVLRQFRIVFNAVRTHFQQIERQAGIGGAQVWALSVIHQHPGMRVTELARAMDVHQSTASNLIRHLTRQQLVDAIRSTADRRHVHLHATPAGLTLLTTVAGPREGVLPQALRRLSGPTLTSLSRSLDDLIRSLPADESSGQKPLAEL